VRSRSGQPCSPARNGRFARPCARSATFRLASGRCPAQLASFSQVPPGCGPDRDRACHPGRVRRHDLRLSSGSSSRNRATFDFSRRLRARPIPRYVVAGIPASSSRGRSARASAEPSSPVALLRSDLPSKPPHPTSGAFSSLLLARRRLLPTPREGRAPSRPLREEWRTEQVPSLPLPHLAAQGGGSGAKNFVAQQDGRPFSRCLEF